MKYMVNKIPVRPAPWDRTLPIWAIYPLNRLQGDDVVAVEIYRYVGEAPPELRRHATWDDAGQCGLTVFWTRAAW